MKPKFNIGQYLVRKGVYPRTKEEYGVFKITPYRFDGINFKSTLIPVGVSRDKFPEYSYYTSDLRDIEDDRIFDDLKLAEDLCVRLNSHET